MVINVIVQYNGGFLLDILLIDPSPYFCMVRWHYYRILFLPSKLGTTLSSVLLCLVSAVDICVQYKGGLLPDIVLLTQGYYHWGTRLNTM